MMNKWLGLQAMSDLPGNVKRVRELMEHPAFDIRNPNKVYALVGGFAGCPVNFHAKDGSGCAADEEMRRGGEGVTPHHCGFLVALHQLPAPSAALLSSEWPCLEGEVELRAACCPRSTASPGYAQMPQRAAAPRRPCSSPPLWQLTSLHWRWREFANRLPAGTSSSGTR